MAKANEFKAAEKLTDYLNNANFSPAVMANVLTTEYTLYTQDRLMELIKYIIHYNSLRFNTEWQKGQTSEGLMLADALNAMLEAKYGLSESVQEHINQSPELNKVGYKNSWVHDYDDRQHVVLDHPFI